jgi:phosphoserine phosphatase
MAKKLIPVAIAYDFDGTLAPGNMQEHSFLPEIGQTPSEFWTETKALAKKNDMDEILAYMYLMLKHANSRDVAITRENFVKHGNTISFFEGVEGWFGRINEHGKALGLNVEHYIISSGLRELVDGTTIRKNFKYVFASGFMYDANGVAIWPALAINYTNKTQHLFRINKGIENAFDNAKINKFMLPEARPVPFSNMIYIGDGETDIPAMKMVKYQGGYSVAVYDRSKRKAKGRESAKDMVHQLLAQERADFAVPADYRDEQPLDRIVKAALEKIAVENRLNSDRKR